MPEGRLERTRKAYAQPLFTLVYIDPPSVIAEDAARELLRRVGVKDQRQIGSMDAVDIARNIGSLMK